MKAEPNELQRAILPTTEAGVPRPKDVVISRRSRVITWFLRQIMPRYLRWMLHGSNKRIARAQLLVASQTCKESSGFAIDYDVLRAPHGCVAGHGAGATASPGQTVFQGLPGGAVMRAGAPGKGGKGGG